MRLDKDGCFTVCDLGLLLPGRGVAALLPDGRRVAFFRDRGAGCTPSTTGAFAAAVLSRGLTGTRQGHPFVASPFLRQRFDLPPATLTETRGHLPRAASVGGERRRHALPRSHTWLGSQWTGRHLRLPRQRRVRPSTATVVQLASEQLQKKFRYYGTDNTPEPQNSVSCMAAQAREKSRRHEMSEFKALFLPYAPRSSDFVREPKFG